jgi:hypothetical protein
LALLKFDAPVLAMISAGLFPAIACWKTGMIENRQVAKIAGYAAIGWMLTFMLQPVAAQTSASHLRRILTLPLLGHEWHVPASAVSTLLALVGVCFAPLTNESTTKRRQDDNSETSDNKAFHQSDGG